MESFNDKNGKGGKYYCAAATATTEVAQSGADAVSADCCGNAAANHLQ
jgi:hypothetical protein